jgi:hypothetical protein
MMIDQINADPSLVIAPYIILHVGTNNINSQEKFSVDDIVRLTNELFNVIWIHNPSAHIIVSSILPRPVDFDVTNEKVKLVNERLQLKCKERNCQFIKSYRPFFFKGRPKRNLYAVRDGGLHLNFAGTDVLKSFFINTISHIVKGKFAM